MRLSKKSASPNAAEEELCRLDQENQQASDPSTGRGYSPINIEYVCPNWMDAISIERCSNSTSTSTSSYEQPEEVESRIEDDQVELDVLWIGDVYQYTIPSFSVVTVDLQHVLAVSADGEQFDAFLRNVADVSIVVR